MAEQSFNASLYKTNQRQEWDSVAAAWAKWWPYFEKGAQVVTDRLIELARIGPGHRVLDIATGIGEPALSVARRVGPAGWVVGTDQSGGMLALARERAEELGLGNLEFWEVDAEELELPSESFDAALCRWGLMFLPDLGGCLMRVHATLRPGGRFAASVWSEPPRVPMIGVTMGVIQRTLQPPPPPPGAPGLFSLANPSLLEHALVRAGFKEVHTERVTLLMEMPSPEQFVQGMLEIAPPIIAMLERESQERRHEVVQAMIEASRDYQVESGVVRFNNETIIVTGQR